MITKGIEPFLLERGYMVYVNGYTDNTGTPMLNEELSTKRALQVAKMLTNLGIDESSIIAKGWGEANMIAPNDTEEGQKKNRRVEIRMRR
jgi:OOP family OmpA-OmpF porin